MEVRVAFLTLCARAGFKDAWPAVEKTLKGVGRMKYLAPPLHRAEGHAGRRRPGQPHPG